MANATEGRLTPAMLATIRARLDGLTDSAYDCGVAVGLACGLLAELDAAWRERDEARTVTEVEGRDAAFWHNSYTMLRDAITENLGAFVKNGEEAEEAILVSAIERAATAMAKDGGA